MKVVRDLSVTSVRGGGAAWDMPWFSPTTQTPPALVLDFDAGVYGTAGVRQTLPNVLTFARGSNATHFDPSGSLVTVGNNTPRIDHDPVSLAPQGLLLETGRTNLLTDTAVPSAQDITVTAGAHVLSFFGTGTVTLSGAHSGSYSGTGPFPSRTIVSFSATAGTLSASFSGNISHPQIEAGAQASSYVESGGTATARADDVATVPLGGWYDNTAGTLVFSGAVLAAAANDRVVELDAGNTSTRLSVLWNTTLGLPQLQVWNSGVLQAAIAPTGSSISLGENFRLVVAYAANDFVISLNGSAVVADTVGSLPASLATLRLGRSIWGAQGLLQTESLVHYADRLPNAELQALSA